MSYATVSQVIGSRVLTSHFWVERLLSALGGRLEHLYTLLNLKRLSGLARAHWTRLYVDQCCSAPSQLLQARLAFDRMRQEARNEGGLKLLHQHGCRGGCSDPTRMAQEYHLLLRWETKFARVRKAVALSQAYEQERGLPHTNPHRRHQLVVLMLLPQASVAASLVCRRPALSWAHDLRVLPRGNTLVLVSSCHREESAGLIPRELKAKEAVIHTLALAWRKR